MNYQTEFECDACNEIKPKTEYNGLGDEHNDYLAFCDECFEDNERGISEKQVK